MLSMSSFIQARHSVSCSGAECAGLSAASQTRSVYALLRHPAQSLDRLEITFCGRGLLTMDAEAYLEDSFLKYWMYSRP